MSLDHFNHSYDGGAPNIPYGVGDRYYAQDWARDFWFLYNSPGRVIKEAYSAFPVLLEDSYIEKGTGWNQIDIPIARGLVEYDVSVPNSFAAIPPTVKTETCFLYVESTAQTDFTMSGATLDGVTTNYVKLAYDESNIASRNRAKKAGSYQYERGRSFSITVTSAAPTNKEVVLAEIVGDGATFLTIDRKTRTPKLNDVYDYVVRTQTDFNQIITRVAANQYKIIDDITSVFFHNLSGGYEMQGGTSFLDGGDSYGYIETNNCKQLNMQSGAFFDVQDTAGYIEVDTDNCILENVYIKGLGTSAVAVAQSFLLNANKVVYNNCGTSHRKASATFYAFRGSGTASHNTTSNYKNCYVHDLENSSVDIGGFYLTENLVDCKIYSCVISSNVFYGVNVGRNIKGCRCEDIEATAGDIFAFYDIDIISDCYVYDLLSGGSASKLRGVSNSSNVSNCIVDTLESTHSNAGYIRGFDYCYQISNCTASNITNATTNASNDTEGFFQCDRISSCYAFTIYGEYGAAGYSNCDKISGCEAFTIDGNTSTALGFSSCDHISSCYAEDIDAPTISVGFYNCEQISACYATDVDGAGIAKGYTGCKYGASLSTDVASSGDYIDTTDAAITNQFSCHPTIWV